MNDVNPEPTETFTYEFHELGEEMTIEESPLDIKAVETNLKWVVKVFGRTGDCTQSYGGNLYEPPEYDSKDEFDHVELTLELDGKVLLETEDWTEWETNPQFVGVCKDIESVDWREVF